MEQYLGLLKRVLSEGKPQYNERTEQFMIVKSGDQSYFDFSQGFPLLTTKPVQMRWVGEELFWMFRGETDDYSLNLRGVNIWNRNAFQHYLDRMGLNKQVKKNTHLWNQLFETYESAMKDDRRFNSGLEVKGSQQKLFHEERFDKNDSTLGPIYGQQWRRWKKYNGETVDQIKKVIAGIKKDPGSRYHVINAWNVAEIDEMAIKPCHPMVHFTVTRDKDLEAHMFQRSCDLFLGVPFNIAQYALFTNMIARETGLNPLGFYHTYSNLHIYNGVAPRTDFLRVEDNLSKLQRKVKMAGKPEDYLDIREWYLKHAPAESEGNERKDHVPFVLEQLSKEPRSLPHLQMKDLHLFQMIEMPAKEVISISGYEPIKWDCRAVMAA